MHRTSILPQGKGRTVFLMIVTALIMAAGGWLLADRLAEVPPVWGLPGDMVINSLIVEKNVLPERILVPEEAESVTISLTALQSLLIMGEQERPLLSVIRKRDGEWGWSYFDAEREEWRRGGVIPADQTPLSFDEPLFVFEFAWDEGRNDKKPITLTEKKSGLQATLPEFRPGIFRIVKPDYHYEGINYDHWRMAGRYQPLGAVYWSAQGITYRYGRSPLKDYRGWIAILLFLSAFPLFFLVRGKAFSFSVMLSAAALLGRGLSVILILAVLLLFLTNVGWTRKKWQKHAALYSVLLWSLLLIVLFCYLFPEGDWLGWRRAVIFGGCFLLLGVLSLLSLLVRRELLGAPLCCWISGIFFLVLAIDLWGLHRMNQLNGRRPAPQEVAWDMENDTDLGYRYYLNLPLRINQWSLGWLGSGVPFGTGLADYYNRFPMLVGEQLDQTAPGLWFSSATHRNIDRYRYPYDEYLRNALWVRPGYGALPLYLLITSECRRKPIDLLIFTFGADAGAGREAADYYLRQQERVERLAPDPADPLRQVILRTKFEHRWQLHLYRYLEKRSYALQYAVRRANLESRARDLAQKQNRPDFTNQAEMQPSHEAILWGLAEYCRRNNIRLVLVPELNNRGEWINPWYAELMKRTADKYDHVDFIDLAAKINDKSEAQNWFVDYVHPNELGHQKIAEMMWEELQSLLNQLKEQRGPRSVVDEPTERYRIFEAKTADGPTIDELLAYQSTTEQ